MASWGKPSGPCRETERCSSAQDAKCSLIGCQAQLREGASTLDAYSGVSCRMLPRRKAVPFRGTPPHAQRAGMQSYILQRLFLALLTFLLATMVIFGAVRALPGDAVLASFEDTG